MSDKDPIHELRNSLNTITVQAELGMLCLEKTGDVSRAMKALNTIVSECKSGGDTITTITELLRDSTHSDNNGNTPE